MHKYILELIVFISGAVVMVLELVGTRILAPYLGTSIFVWTSLIGIILGSLSLGYWLGGRLADKKQSYRIFALIIFSAAVLIGLVAVFQSVVLLFLPDFISDIRIAAILATLILFAPASVFLGMVSPYAVRLKIKDLQHSGATIGRLYAISTIGSIAGTFLTGFFLIAYLGSTKILYLLSAILILISILAYYRDKLKFRVSIFLLIILSFIFSNYIKENSEFIDLDTRYNRVWIYQSIDEETARPILSLITDPYGSQSAMFLDRDDDLVFEYTKYFRLAKHFQPNLKKSLMIGGAGYSYAKDYLDKYDQAIIDVVEIDSQLTELAKKYFNLKDNSRLTIYHEDARTFLNRTSNKYDAIFIDAFTSHLSIPFQLTTMEAVEKIYQSLNQDGVVLVNIISAIEGDKGKFLRAQLATYQTKFKQVYLFPIDDPTKANLAQNIMLVAIKTNTEPSFISDNNELNSYLRHLWIKTIELDLPVLTDEQAPVDFYVKNLIS